MKKILVLLFVILLVLSTEGKENMGKKAIVIAAFGTSYPTALQSILNIKTATEKAYPNAKVKIAFTSNIIRKIWQKRAVDKNYRKKNKDIPNNIYSVKTPLATIANLQNDGYRTIVVQSSHVFAGEEYLDLQSYVSSLNMIRTGKKKFMPFDALVLGRPALGEPGVIHDYHEDIERGVLAVAADVEKAKKTESTLVYMGHGNEYLSTGIYAEFQKALREKYKYSAIFVGTVEGYPAISDVIDGLKHSGAKKVLLKPFMVVAGDHANNDMAGDEEDSWKNLIEDAGIKVTTEVVGLGMNPKWVSIYVDHIGDIITDSKIEF